VNLRDYLHLLCVGQSLGLSQFFCFKPSQQLRGVVDQKNALFGRQCSAAVSCTETGCSQCRRGAVSLGKACGAKDNQAAVVPDHMYRAVNRMTTTGLSALHSVLVFD
jgi:hypothetical protein